MYLKYTPQREHRTARNGNQIQPFVRNILKARTAKGIILPCASSLVTALFLIPALMSSPFTTDTVKLPISASAVDYNQPVQYVPQQIRSTSKGSIVNDWREFSFTRTIQDSYDISSFRISAFAVDNYGVRLQMWVSVYVSGGNNDGQVLYNRGWSTDSINQESFTTFPARGSNIIVYMRYRYPTGAGDNPPALSMVAPARVTIDFTEAVNVAPQQTTAIPPEWLVTTTADVPTLIDTSTTVVSIPQEYSTTVAPNTVEDYLTIPDKVRIALVFALGIVGRFLALKYVTPAICFGLIVALAGWLLH